MACSLSFLDVDINEWYYADIAKGVAAGYISGYSDNEFAPQKNITLPGGVVELLAQGGGLGSGRVGRLGHGTGEMD